MKTPTAKRNTSIPLLVAVILGVFSHCGSAQANTTKSYLEKWEAIGPNVRIMRHQDGSRTEFRRSPDDRTLTKKTTSTNGAVILVTIYRLDSNGNPRGCQIFDGKSTLLYKVSYGYHRTTGQLVAEDMFDARVKYLDSEGKVMPVRRMYYTYDAHGNRSKAQAFVNIKGKLAEEVYDDAKATFLKSKDNPFEVETANPRGRPVGGR